MLSKKERILLEMLAWIVAASLVLILIVAFAGGFIF